ncbi:MAG TPA: hypothetical protein VMF55_08005 [Solirubrobacterales bacterium]|nr:hypothetical protein [Solirubrobacterales bacterium]
MIWLGWRQQRTEALIALAIVAALAALLIPTGISMSSAVHHESASAFAARFSSLGNLIAWLTLIPGLIGVLLAAPFVLALEHGTYRLDWTQSVPRRRWVATKLGLSAASAIVAAGVLLLLLTWWREPFVELQGRVAPAVYDSEGTVVFAYTLVALALATAIGAVWRRAVPALAVGLVLYVGARVFVDTWLRERLVAADTAVWSVNHKAPNLDKTWILEQFPADGHGAHIPNYSCQVGAGGACALPTLHHGFIHAVYQPASHFWSLQLTETAIFGAIAAALLCFAGWWTRNRVA